MQQELIQTRPNGLEAPPASPMDLIHMAVQRGAGVEEVRQLMQLKKEWDADLARKEYAAAFVRMRPKLPLVVRTKDNLQTKSRYAPLEEINQAVNPILEGYGFSTSTRIVEQDADSVTVAAELWHSSGHVESTKIKMPLDKSGIQGTVNKTLPHALASSVMYGRRVALCALLNISTGDDVDGNGPSGSGLPDGVLQERLDWLDNCRNRDELQKVFSEAYRMANAANDKNAMAKLIQRKAERYKELSK